MWTGGRKEERRDCWKGELNGGNGNKLKGSEENRTKERWRRKERKLGAENSNPEH